MTEAQIKKIKTDLIWELIEFFQEQRMVDESCEDKDTWSDKVLSYNDVEIALYDKMTEIDPEEATGI